MEEDVQAKPERNGNRKKAVVTAIFMVVFGLILAVLTYVTLIGPVIGVLIAGFGVYLLWRTTQTKAPM